MYKSQLSMEFTQQKYINKRCAYNVQKYIHNTYVLKCQLSMEFTGMEITEKFCLSGGKVSKKSTCPPLVLPVPTVQDIKTSENRQNFSLSFGKVPKIFTCPPLFLPVPDRRTVSNFHP